MTVPISMHQDCIKSKVNRGAEEQVVSYNLLPTPPANL